jgi:hypothetical protein
MNLIKIKYLGIVLLFVSCMPSKSGVYQIVNDDQIFYAFILELKKDSTFNYYQYRSPSSSAEHGKWRLKKDSILLNSEIPQEAYYIPYDYNLRRFKNEYFLIKGHSIFIKLQNTVEKTTILARTKHPYKDRFNP